MIDITKLPKNKESECEIEDLPHDISNQILLHTQKDESFLCVAIKGEKNSLYIYAVTNRHIILAYVDMNRNNAWQVECNSRSSSGFVGLASKVPNQSDDVYLLHPIFNPEAVNWNFWFKSEEIFVKFAHAIAVFANPND